jgi:hypothetical protein
MRKVAMVMLMLATTLLAACSASSPGITSSDRLACHVVTLLAAYERAIQANVRASIPYDPNEFYPGVDLREQRDQFVRLGEAANDAHLSYEARRYALDSSYANTGTVSAATGEVSDFNKFVARCNALGLKNA